MAANTTVGESACTTSTSANIPPPRTSPTLSSDTQTTPGNCHRDYSAISIRQPTNR